jgi:colanic acid/amylovoran biosynthesis glycosyltransferase
MKTNKQPRVLLVMHNVPADSVFLAAKFIRLLERLDVHLLVWDEPKRIEAFIKSNNLNEHRGRIHNGISNSKQALTHVLTILLLILRDKKVRRFVFSQWSKTSFATVFKYLPIFSLQPDIIHFEFGTLASDIKDLRQLTDAKTIVSFRGYDLNFVGLEEQAYYNKVWQYADALHFLGNDLKQRAIKRGYQSDKPEALIAPAIDTAIFSPRSSKAKNEVLKIISVGRLTWKKGFEFAILAMRKLGDKNIPFEYHIVGEGPHRQAIQYAIYENGLQQHIHIHGKKGSIGIRDLLRSADVFLHPAISEGFSNAVIEAQACGLSIICTDADGLAENIEDGITGFIVPKWDSAAIADKIEWCIANRGKLYSIGQKGVERVHAKFRIEDQVTAFVDFYNRVYES